MDRIKTFFRSISPFKRRSATVRYMFSFSALAIVVAFLSAQVIDSTKTSYVKIEASAELIEAGDVFTVDVLVSAHQAVNAVDVTLRFDSNAVEVLQVDRGQSVLTIWTEDPVIEKNKVILRGGTFRRGFIGEHKLASIDLLAKNTGQSTFSVTDVVLLAGDGEGSPVTVSDNTDSQVNLYIYDENTSPQSIGIDVEIRIITDIDGDGKVTLKDISSFMASWASKDVLYDFNGDNRMTFKDFSIILADFFLRN